MLNIQMPVEELLVGNPVTVGDRERIASATAIAFINDNLFISASFTAQNIYLVEIKDSGHKILQKIHTNIYPDLMDYKDGLLAISGYPHGSPSLTGWCSLYKYEDNKLVHYKDIPLKGTKAHGVEIIDEWSVIITSNSDHNRGLLFINIDTGEVVRNFNEFDLYPKDCIIKKDRLLLVTSRSLPQTKQKTIIKESKLYLFSFPELAKLDEITFHGQTDSLTLLDTNGFITVQGSDELVHFTCINDKLSFIKRIPGFNFPHGIDSFSDKVAITNYGTNQILIFDINEFL